MEKLLENSIVKALTLSAHTELGPQLVYTFPEFSEEGSKQLAKDRADKREAKKEPYILNQQEYMMITIKNLSLVLSDEIISVKVEQKPQYFCIVPFPDFSLMALTYYHYIGENIFAFSILVEESKRNFLYNNHKRLKKMIIRFFDEFDAYLTPEFAPQEQTMPFFQELLNKILLLEQQKAGPVFERKLKIILAGLDDSGKTSFLLSVDRKFSKLMNLKPTAGAKTTKIQALGATLFVWDLGGQNIYREKYLTKSSIYLYEADLIFYFIDIQNRKRFEESLEYLRNINHILMRELDQEIPIIFIFSKADLDILDTKEIQKNIRYLKNEIKEITHMRDLNVFTTSIFEISTVLRAFSEGIKSLSINREIINYNLKRFSRRIGSDITLLLSNEGLVLSNYYSAQVEQREILQDVFEITAPQFTMLYKIFYKFKALNKEQAIFQVSNSTILIKKIEILEKQAFILFLLEDLKRERKIEELLPIFLQRIRSLLSTYI